MGFNKDRELESRFNSRLECSFKSAYLAIFSSSYYDLISYKQIKTVASEGTLQGQIEIKAIAPSADGEIFSSLHLF